MEESYESGKFSGNLFHYYITFLELENPFQSELRLMGYKGKTLVLKAISKLNQRIKRLGIDVKEVKLFLSICNVL